MPVATEIFFLRARDHARRPPVAVTADATLREVIGRMATEKASAAVVVDGGRGPVGIVTERDIVRRATFAAPPEQPVGDLMSFPVRCIREDEHLFIAIARMRRLGHRHMPVIDGEGRLAGILDLHDAMARAAEDMVLAIDDLTRDDSDDGLREIKAAQVRVADTLFDANVAVGDIQATLSHVNNDIYARLLERNLAAMAGEGLDAAPAPFAMIIMGSGGRHENFLVPDQDYGFVVEGGADALDEDADRWFADLARRLSRDLDAVGIPYCTGGVMATNLKWRRTLAGWREQVNTWCRRARVDPLLDFDIFFDFRLGWGESGLAAALREHVTERTAGNETFLREVYSADRDHRTALKWFGRFATESADPAHRGKVNLKLHGILPLVEAARLFALRDGVPATSTRDRLAAAHAAGVLTDDEHDELEGARRTICRLLLGRQLADFRAGAPVSSFVDPKGLTPRRKRDLRQALRAVERLRARMRVEFGGDVL